MQKKSYDSAEIRLHKLDIEKVMNSLRNYARKAVEKGAIAVVLIGSLARGDYTAYSDADVVIIIPRSDKNPIDRIPDYMDPALPIDLEPRVYTIDEIIRMAREKRRIIHEITSYGKLLAGDKDFIEYLKRLCNTSDKN
ncbi:MAG: nucleotidyltransferase domain-containing protein [Thermoprotei archaeon]